MNRRDAVERRLRLRGETPADYAQIAEITAWAHRGEMEVSLLVDALRQHRGYDPELSLLAEVDGQVVGHALYLPVMLLLGGEPVPMAPLSPLTVAPGWQRLGIGGRLMAEGERRLAARGCRAAFLLGHDSYYPRFGYRTRMFGACRLRVPRERLAEPRNVVAERDVRCEDLPLLLAMWHAWFDDVDLAWVPTATAGDWLSPMRSVRDAVLTSDGETAGYARYPTERPHELSLFVARDGGAARDLLAYLAERLPAENDELLVPVHPRGRAVGEWLAALGEPQIEPWSAAMIKVLPPDDGRVAAYCEQVAAGDRAPGCLLWPTVYDVV